MRRSGSVVEVRRGGSTAPWPEQLAGVAMVAAVDAARLAPGSDLAGVLIDAGIDR